MTKAEMASMIDAYADAKASGNKYLVQKMIEDLEMALNEVCGGTDMPPAEIPQPPHKLPPLTPPGAPTDPNRVPVGAEY
jgi:hypothetical protein